ncbi:Toluene efflux pump outer membrane protein TtgI precursor [Rubripirellula amarantea]|uniref:Toluene efflux pump outer membrane protein TtgI n=1 Tax=Rubripirellula amarantea TaxID=2527999 RepID=A0A5C5WRS6_9BACT|nr:efflux transporter outer membrane subunit [Rubripirellula amarantea]TWT52841.1 Toluene efflux pump outer membrane protein TtgI precursor [Rubripirellula amarantea]
MDLNSRYHERTSMAIGFASLSLAVFMLLHSGCATVGPDYGGVEPPPLNAGFLGDNAEGSVTQISSESTSGLDDALNLALAQQEHPADWSFLNDEYLPMLIARSVRDNPSVDELTWRIQEAKSVVRIVSGQADPFADAFTTYERRKRSSNAQPFVASNGSPFHFFSLGVDSRWEIDIVGRIARETEAAKADYQATEEDLVNLRRVLAADIARAYINLRLNQELLRQNQLNLKVQRDSIEEVEDRIEAGQVTRLDLVQLQSRIGLTESDQPIYEQGIQQSYNLIALLMGTTPSECEAYLLRPTSQLSPPPISPEVPAELLRRRPDVRRSEREIAAACARIGVAKAEYYPRLSLLGTVSVDSRKVSNLLDYDSLVFAFGPGVTWNILSLGRIEAQVDIQKAQLKQAIARYRQSVLVAVSEVENALAAQGQQRRRIEILTQTVNDSGEAVELARQQYGADKASLERVVSNQRRLLRSSIELARARADSATAAVDLFQALGGGDVRLTAWQQAVCGHSEPCGGQSTEYVSSGF